MVAGESWRLPIVVSAALGLRGGVAPEAGSVSVMLVSEVTRFREVGEREIGSEQVQSGSSRNA